MLRKILDFLGNGFRLPHLPRNFKELETLLKADNTYERLIDNSFIQNVKACWTPKEMSFLIDKSQFFGDLLYSLNKKIDRHDLESICDRGVMLTKISTQEWGVGHMSSTNTTPYYIALNQFDDYFQRCCENYGRIMSEIQWKSASPKKDQNFLTSTMIKHQKILDEKISKLLVGDTRKTLTLEEKADPKYAPYYCKILAIREDAKKQLKSNPEHDPRAQELYRLLAAKPTLILCDANYEKFIQ